MAWSDITPEKLQGYFNAIFGPGGAEAYIRGIGQQAGTQIGMATMPQFQQYMKQQAGALAGRGGLGGGSQVWAMGEAQKARSGQMIGAVAGATQSAQRDVLSAKQSILQQLIMAEIQRHLAAARRKAQERAAMWQGLGQIGGSAVSAIGMMAGGGGEGAAGYGEGNVWA